MLGGNDMNPAWHSFRDLPLWRFDPCSTIPVQDKRTDSSRKGRLEAHGIDLPNSAVVTVVPCRSVDLPLFACFGKHSDAADGHAERQEEDTHSDKPPWSGKVRQPAAYATHSGQVSNLGP